MTEVREQYEAALEIANTARVAWLNNPSKPNFIAWRDASDIAIKWQRALQRGGVSPIRDDDPLAEFDEIARQSSGGGGLP
jgi:hypothetical protein